MANTFKLKTKADVSATAETLYTVPATIDSAIVLGLILANKVSGPIETTVLLNSATTDNEVNENVTLLNAIPIPDHSTLEMFSGQKLVLQPNDSILVSCDSSTSLDVSLSILEVSS